MEARPVLGVSAMRPAFLVDIPAAGRRESETSDRACVMTAVTFADISGVRMVRLDDDVEDDFDDDDDESDEEDDDEDDDEDEDDDQDEEEPETWQVVARYADRAHRPPSR
jgi:hypothetical protein